jgi:hypothetical protein
MRGIFFRAEQRRKRGQDSIYISLFLFRSVGHFFAESEKENEKQQVTPKPL